MNSKPFSQIIRLDHDCISYQLSNGGWQLPVSEIKIVGEHTDNNGPLIDDYFLVFVTESDVYEASFYAEGRDELLRKLGVQLGTRLSCELYNSVDYRSRVMWPPDMEGVALFDYSNGPMPEGFWAKLKYKFFPNVYRTITDAVKQKLKSI